MNDVQRVHLGSYGSSYYERGFRVKNKIFKGYLTCEIGEKYSGIRDVLIVNHLPELIPENERNSFNKFTNLLDIVEADGNIGKAKEFIKLKNTNREIEQIKVIEVVHMFGPVPVFDTGYRLQYTLDGVKQKVRLAVYCSPYALNLEKGNNVKRVQSGLYVISSLEDKLDQILRRYYEDVGAILRDITHNADLEKAIVRLKDIENIIGKSITSKLRYILPKGVKNKDDKEFENSEWCTWKNNTNSLSTQNLERKKFFERNHSQILSATYFRSATLYLINFLYALIGISSQRSNYFSDLKSKTAPFEEYFGSGLFDSLEQSSPEIYNLHQFMQFFESKDKDKIFRKTPLKVSWLEKFVEFIRLLYFLEEYNKPSNKGRVFISFKHEIPEAKVTKEQIKNHLNEKYNTLGLHAYSLDENSSDDYIEERIKAMIWQSDKTISLLVSKSSKLELIPDSFHDWILSESEHTVMQGKGVVFAKQKDVDKGEFDKILAESNYKLLTKYSWDNATTRRENLVKEWESHAHVNFTVDLIKSEHKYLDPDLRDKIERDSIDITKKRREKILKGFLTLIPFNSLLLLESIALNFYSEDKTITKKAIKRIMDKEWQSVSSRMKKYSRKPGSFDAEFAYFYKNTKTRSLEIENKTIHLFKNLKNRSHYYHLGVFDVLPALNGNSSVSQYKDETLRIIKEVINESIERAMYLVSK